MQEFVKDESSKNNLIFTEDLKNMVHIAEKDNTPLLISMIKRFCSQSKEVRFGNFVFGPVVMRLFHHLHDQKTALELFKDESLNGFFDQLITYQILLDLLYESGNYQEVLDTFNIIRSRQLQGSRYPKHSIIIVLAACYKLNTPEAYAYGKEVWHGAIEAGHYPLRRAATFLATLAYLQNDPAVAIEVLGNLRGQNYVSVRALKSLALTRTKRYEDVIPILRSILDIANPMFNKQTFPKDTIEILKKEFEAGADKDLQQDFEKVCGFLENHGHISNQTLDEILCSEIQMLDPDRRQTNQYGDGGGNQRFNNNRGGYERGGVRKDLRQVELDRPSRPYTRRPGLHELN